ncbi:MAG: zinc metalloprotease HtpX [Phycisphaerae bacterium]
MYRLWNNFKTTLLMGGLMGLCLGIGYLVGGRSALVPALVIGGAMNFVAFFYSDRIALATMRAKEISREDDPVLWDTVASLSERADLPMPRVCVSPAAAPNAFATGRGPKHSAVCVTAGLRRMLTESELAGVVAHELSHVKHRDVLISTVAAAIGGAITVLGYLALFFGGGDRKSPLVGLLIIITAPIAAGLIRMAISRSREYEADRRGAELAGSPHGLANALRKLESAGRQVPLPVPESQSNMFIVEPLTGKETQKLFMSHPPVEDRVRRLLAMDK